MGEDRGRTWRALVVAVHLAALAMISSEASAGPRFAASNGGQTVHDDLLHVTWLVNANLPKKRTYGLTININGSMNYLTALSWIYKLNTDNSGRGYLGHTTWTLPTQPTHDPSCTTQGPKPHHNRFAYDCTGSSLGSLYYDIVQELKPLLLDRLT